MPPARTVVTSLGLGLTAFLVAAEARAADTHGREDFGLIDRPHTVAEIEAGIIALPNAPISVANQGGSTPFGTFGKGDATVQTGIHLLYRASAAWAFGAGALFAPKPTTDDQYRTIGGQAGIPRTHSRSYLSLGAEIRYHFPELRSRWFEAWAGVNGGAVIIADRFVTKVGDDVPTILGTKEVTVRTEGISVGLQLGVAYLVSENWVIGLAGRGALWFLPDPRSSTGQDPRCSPIGDCPTLNGTVQAFEIGITVGYRIPL